MKKFLLFKKFLIVILLIGLSLAGWAQVLYEDFNYATPAYIGGNGNAGTSSNNWTTHSVTAGHTTTVDIADGSLTYTGLKSSNGNKVNFFSNANATDRDINRAFTSSATAIYYSALVNIIDNSQITVAGDYFMNIGASAGSSAGSLGGRLGIKSVNTGANFRFLIQNTSTGTITFTDNGTDLSFGTTYLVVVKYDRSASPTVANLWVNPTSLGGTEPSGSVSNSSGTATFASFGSICLRNNAASPKAYIDEIRVGETWADVTPVASVTSSITVTAPVAGNLWAQGSTHNITWTATGTNTNVKIEYTGNASDVTPTWVTINETDITAASAGTYAAQIPVDLLVSSDSKIRITDIPQTAAGLSGVFSIVAAPAPVAVFNPADAATGVDNASNITVTFNVPVRNIDDSEITDANVASLITLKTTDAAGTAVPFTATIDVDKKVITINPDADLANEQLYYLAIAPVEGLSNNATVEQSATFTTAASLAPELSDVTIAETGPYYAGDQVTINWVSKNITDVTIEAWVPSENMWMDLLGSIPSDGSETFTIPVDAQYSTEYKLRVVDAATPSVTAESSVFTIIGALNNVAITETAPYYAGGEVTVTWTAKNISTVKIQLLDPATSTWSDLATAFPAADGSKKVTLPANLPTRTDYKIKVTNEINNTGLESAAFEAIAVVNDLITLRAVPAGVKVKFAGVATVTYARTSRNQKYIQDATAAVLIDDPTTAPGFITGTYNIGDGITNIVGKIVLYGGLIEFTPTATTGEPATGIEIVPEVRTLASLTSADQCKLVKIENFAFKTPRKFVKSLTYAIDGYDSLAIAYRTIFAESDYIGGQAPVGPISSIVLVGQYNAQMQITARSWSDMVIPTSIAVTSPVGGESYEQGSTQTITWTTTNFTGDVKIELTGSNPSVIVAAVANTGSFTWDIPETLTVASDYKIMISDAVDGNPMGESVAVFSITEKPFVAPAIVITEIMYTSPDVSAKQEWVELYNNGTTSVDMEGFYILDSDPLHKADPILLPAGSVLAPGDYYTIETSDNGQPELFPFVPDFVSIKFNLGKTDEVKLFHSNGKLIDSVSYSYLAPWPTSPNGGGSSLTLCDPNLDNSLASSWEASEDAFTTLQGTTILATPGSGCVLHTAVKPQALSGISVYPNPTTDNLYISNPANGMLEITVLSSIGKTVRTIQSNQGVTSIDFSSMPKGIYMMKMFNKTLKTTQMNKIVVN